MLFVLNPQILSRPKELFNRTVRTSMSMLSEYLLRNTQIHSFIPEVLRLKMRLSL